MDIPFSPKWYVMAKPAGAHCNLHCDYCYYRSTAGDTIYEGRFTKDNLRFREVSARCSLREGADTQFLDTYIRQYIQLTPVGEEVVFIWHGGEPLLRPLSYYQEAVRLQKHHADGHPVSNIVQTNGTLLTDEWCRFFHDEQWTVGISIDGPEEVHNRYRGTSFARVMQGIERLQKHAVSYTVMAVISDESARQPLQVYHFLRRLGTPFLQLEPQAEPHLAGMVSPQEFAAFYNAVFDEWYAHDIGNVYIELFDNTLAMVMGYPSSTCIYSPRCGNAPVVEADGMLYCCDHYVPQAPLGNIFDTPLLPLLSGERMFRFGQQKMPTANRCASCQFLSLCYGGCPRHRDATGVNRLCKGYQAFFRHTLPYFNAMAATIRQKA